MLPQRGSLARSGAHLGGICRQDIGASATCSGGVAEINQFGG